MNTCTDFFQIIMLIIAAFFLSFAIGCGSEEKTEEEKANDLFYGWWSQETSCGYTLNIKKDYFIISHLCFVDVDNMQASVKKVLFDNEERKLSGKVVKTTCEDDLNTDFSIDYTIEKTNSMTLETKGGAIVGLYKMDGQEENKRNSLNIIWGCNKTGEFVYTQIYE